MYGYVVPDKPNMLLKEYALYRAHYCGLCKAAGRIYGQAARLVSNYDITFFSLFMHDYHGLAADFKKAACILNPIKRKLVLKANPLLEKIVALNVLTAYRNLKDDVVDGEGAGKAAAAWMLKRAARKARKRLPEADLLIIKHYNRLLALEKNDCPRTDEAADCFACMLSETAVILGEGAPAHAENAGRLKEFFYQLGRWIYVADALDDLDADYCKGGYNPLLAEFPGYKGRREFVAAHREEIRFYLYSAANAMSRLLSEFNFTQCQNLLRNVVVYGIPKISERLLNAEGKLKKERI